MVHGSASPANQLFSFLHNSSSYSQFSKSQGPVNIQKLQGPFLICGSDDYFAVLICKMLSVIKKKRQKCEAIQCTSIQHKKLAAAAN
jgi:hypothetical protein